MKQKIIENYKKRDSFLSHEKIRNESMKHNIVDKCLAKAVSGINYKRKNQFANSDRSQFSSMAGESLCYLPLEDGGIIIIILVVYVNLYKGLRFISVSNLIEAKSIHNLCNSTLCGVCLSPKIIDNPFENNIFKDGYKIINKSFGSVFYDVHKHCQDTIENTSLFDFNISIEFNDIYRYDSIDDASCDLCGN